MVLPAPFSPMSPITARAPSQIVFSSEKAVIDPLISSAFVIFLRSSKAVFAISMNSSAVSPPFFAACTASARCFFDRAALFLAQSFAAYLGHRSCRGLRDDETFALQLLIGAFGRDDADAPAPWRAATHGRQRRPAASSPKTICFRPELPRDLLVDGALSVLEE